MRQTVNEKIPDYYTAIVVALWAVYALASFMSPNNVASSQKYGVSMLVLALLLSTLLVPILAIWMFAVAGCRHFFEFSRTLKLKAKRKAYHMIAIGLMIIAGYLIIIPTMTSLYVLWGGNTLDSLYVIARNYISVLSTLASFAFMFAGSIMLLRVQRQKVPSMTILLNAGLPVTLFTLLYSYLVFSNPIRQTGGDNLASATFYLSDPIIVMTIIAPAVATWMLGLMLIINMEHYSRYTKIANRRGIIDFYNGMLVVVAGLILSQIVNSLGVGRTSELSLGVVLIILYLLLGLIAFGFALIARGAKRIGVNPDQARATGKRGA